jgi:hypothetical protein
MALDFPNSPTNGQTYTDAGTGEQWVYESATNSWTSKGLVNTSGGLQFKGSLDITAAPPTGVSAGWQYSSSTTGTPNAGFTGLSGTVNKGEVVMYTGTGWILQSHTVPDATAVVKGIDTQKWTRTGTELSPATAGDSVFTTGAVKVGGTTAAPNLQLKADGGIVTPNLQIKGDGGIVANTNGLVYDAATKRLGIGTTAPAAKLEVQDGSISIGSSVNSNATNTLIAGYGYIDLSGAKYGNTSIRSTYLNIDNSASLEFYVASNSTKTNERMRLDSSGRLLVGTSTDSGGALLQVNGDRVRIATAKTPASATAAGVAGEICWDASYVYVCVAANTWKRSAIATW